MSAANSPADLELTCVFNQLRRVDNSALKGQDVTRSFPFSWGPLPHTTKCCPNSAEVIWGTGRQSHHVSAYGFVGPRPP